MKILGYERHPIADAFPLLEGLAFELFLEDVKHNGLVDRDLWLYKGKLLDGSNRGRAAEQLGLKPRFREYEGDDPIGFVVSRNLQRRQLNESQRAMVADKLCTLQQGQTRKTRKFAGLTQPEAAKAFNVSERSLQSARAVGTLAIPELAAAVERGDVAVSRAAELARLGADEQRAALEAELASSRPRAKPSAPKNDEQPSPATAAQQLCRAVKRGVEQLGATVQDLQLGDPSVLAGDFRIAYAGRIYSIVVRDAGAAELAA